MSDVREIFGEATSALGAARPVAEAGATAATEARRLAEHTAALVPVIVLGLVLALGIFTLLITIYLGARR